MKSIGQYFYGLVDGAAVALLIAEDGVYTTLGVRVDDLPVAVATFRTVESALRDGNRSSNLNVVPERTLSKLRAFERESLKGLIARNPWGLPVKAVKAALTVIRAYETGEQELKAAA